MIKIRSLHPSDWQMLRDMRLHALQTNPNYFLDAYDTAVNQPDDYWANMLSDPKKQVFGLFDGYKMIGITSVFTSIEDPSGETAILAMSFILPEYRGQGLSKIFFNTRIEWALGQPHLKKLNVSHREDNEASKNAIKSFGFEFVNRGKIRWPDGTEEYDYAYELELDKLRTVCPLPDKVVKA